MNNMQGFDVYLKFRKIDTVFFMKGTSSEEVKKSLVGHDGYHPDIVVVLASK